MLNPNIPSTDGDFFKNPDATEASFDAGDQPQVGLTPNDLFVFGGALGPAVDEVVKKVRFTPPTN